MLHDAHTKKISLPLTAPVGTNTIVAAVPGAWIYVHEISGDMAADGTVEFLSGTTSLGKYYLDAGQGLTVQDEPGMDGVPRFECKPGDNFVIVVTGGTFDGAIDYSLRY